MSPRPVRRRHRIVVALVAAVVLNGCGLQPGWLQPGQGPGRAGHNPSETVLTDANAATLSMAWSVDLGDDSTLDPAVSTVSGNAVHAVSGNFIHTLSMGDGSEIWSSIIGQAGVSKNHEPSVLGGYVFVGSERTDGSDDEGPHYWAIWSGFHGIWFIKFAPNGSITVRGNDFAFTEREVSPQGQVTLYLLYVSESDGWGSVLLEGGPNTPPVTSVSMSNAQIALGIGDEVLAFPRTGPAGCYWDINPPTCAPEWRRTLGGTVTVPVMSDNGASLFVGDASGGVSVLDAATGDIRWTADVGASGVVATPTFGDGLLYVTTDTGDLLVYDANGCGAPTCAARWTADTGSPVRRQAALAGGVLFVGSEDGTVRAYLASGCGTPTCAPIWQTSTGRAITGGPAVTQGTLLVGTADGRLIAYRPS